MGVGEMAPILFFALQVDSSQCVGWTMFIVTVYHPYLVGMPSSPLYTFSILAWMQKHCAS